MKATLIFLCGAASVTAIAYAREADELNPPPPPQRPIVTPVAIRIFDTNNDREVSAEEIRRAPRVLAKLDRNRDGRITMDEVNPRGGNPPPDQQLPAVITALDANKDGKVTADELSGAAEALKALDLDDNGELSVRELLRRPPPVDPRRRRAANPQPDGPEPATDHPAPPTDGPEPAAE